MKRILALIIILLVRSLAARAFTVEAEGGPLYGAEGEVALYSAVSFRPIGPLTASLAELDLPEDDAVRRYSLASIRLEGNLISFRSLFAVLPSFDSFVDTDELSASAVSCEIRHPLAFGLVGAGYAAALFPSLAGENEWMTFTAQDIDLSAAYGFAAFDDAVAFALGGRLSGRLDLFGYSEGRFDGWFGAAGASWKGFGIAAAYSRGDCSLHENALARLLAYSTADAVASIGTACAWGRVRIERGRFSFAALAALGLVWSFETSLHVHEKDRTIFNPGESDWMGEALWDPAGVALLCASLSVELTPFLSARLSRIVPLAWGWNFSDGSSDGGAGPGSSASGSSIPWDRILLSGLSLSARLTFD
jgi:hypothetical protein